MASYSNNQSLMSDVQENSQAECNKRNNSSCSSQSESAERHKFGSKSHSRQSRKDLRRRSSSSRSSSQSESVERKRRSSKSHNRQSRKDLRRRSSRRSHRERSKSRDKGEGVTVGSVTYVDGKRVRDKKLVCFACKAKVGWLSRHLERCHRDNILVARVVSKSGASRRNGLKRLKHLGAFQHNTEVLKKGRGQLIVARRSHGKHRADSYLPCKRCYGFYHRYDLWRHSCPGSTVDNVEDKSAVKSSVVEASRDLLDGAMLADEARIDHNLNKFVLRRMRRDKKFDIIKSDDLILKFGLARLRRVGMKGHRHIAARMRLLAELLSTVRKSLDMHESSLSEFLDGTYYDAVVEATEHMSGVHYDDCGQRVFTKPSVAIMTGNLLTKCCELKRGVAIKQEDDVAEKAVERFVALLKSNWADCLSCPALASQKTKMYNKPDELPSTEDLMKLKQYTEKRLDDLSKQLTVEPSFSAWRELSEIVLTRLLVFNKRRASEPAKLELSQFQNRPNWKTTSSKELFNNLKPIEKVLMKRMDLIQVPGKRNRRVPILITPEVGRAMQLLFELRDRCGIPVRNKYFFATNSDDGHLNTWLVLHTHALAAGVETPRLITSCKLRKYVATLAQVKLDFIVQFSAEVMTTCFVQ